MFDRLLEDVEQAGDNVLTTRQEIIDLDRRRNSNREAIRNLQRQANQHFKGILAIWMHKSPDYMYNVYDLIIYYNWNTLDRFSWYIHTYMEN